MESPNSISGLGQISNVVSLNNSAAIAVNGSISGLTAVPATAVTVPVSGAVQAVQGLPQLTWYNYSPDGVGQILSGPAVQVELAGNSDIARQFNQQVNAQYGQIQVQLVQAPSGHPQQQQQHQVIPIQIPQQHIQQATLQQQPQQQQQQQQQQITQLQQLEQDGNVKMEQDMFITNTTTTSNTTTDVIKKSRTKTVGNDRVPCPICKKTVSCIATLRDHMRTHTGERPFPCTECDLAFSQRSNLRMHKRLHTGERPYMCGICGKTFARSSHLPAHMRTHTGEKPFACEDCGHAFITAQQLKNHHRVHTGEKPWKCDLCDAAFTHSSSLSTHKKKHTGNKPFQCDKCSKKFFFTSALDKHMKVHTKTRPFKCGGCENTFKYKESLTVHEQRYCGRQAEKKQRAPRKPDAKKPGPKPGTGRKYVQQRKGRPRGRPRKKGRWAKRTKKTKPEPKEDEAQEEPTEVLGMKDDIMCEKESEIIYQPEQLDDDENIPVAELKVENIEGTNETRVLMEPLSSSTSSRITGVTSLSGVHGSNLLSDGVDTVVDQDHQASDLGPNIMQLDPNTSLTIVTAEEAERHMAAGGLQLLTIQPDMLLSMQNSQHAQLITAEQLQQLQQQQQQLHNTQPQQHVEVQQQRHQQLIQVNHEQVQQQVQQQSQHPTTQQPIAFNGQPSNLTHELVVKDGVHVYYPRQFS